MDIPVRNDYGRNFFLLEFFKKYNENSPKPLKSKYFLLAVLIILSFFGFQLIICLNRNCFCQAFYFTIYSFKNNLLTDLFYKLMSANPGAVVEGIYSVFKSSIIENRHVVFNNSMITFIFFAVPLFFVFSKEILVQIYMSAGRMSCGCCKIFLIEKKQRYLFVRMLRMRFSMQDECDKKR
jgi:hypothetical protein